MNKHVASYPSATEQRRRIGSGALRVTELAEHYLGEIARQEKTVQAFAWHDPAFVSLQAGALEGRRVSGAGIGALHGLPVGIKDIIDTARIPTENGCSLDAGRVPTRDAFVVARLKQAGALIMGKTATTELAFMDPATTRNPHDLEHTPGGSSSGSAAAVAAGMVPLAIGTQTGGSVIRPAAYCGVVGYKPSFGAIPRTGILAQSPSLDTVGVFARTVEDVALLAEVLCGHDEADPATSTAPRAGLFDVAMSAPPVTPELAFVMRPTGIDADADTQTAFASLRAALDGQYAELDLPAAFAEGAQAQTTIQSAELAKSLFGYARRGHDRLGPRLQAAIAAGNDVLARDYIAALDWRGVLNAALAEIFERFDAIVTPAAPGAAPRGLDSTGMPTFNAIWTLCGTPAITIPLLQTANGMPIGVQLIGRVGSDARLLRTARWMMQHVADRAAMPDQARGDI